jgi:LysR family nitrogen assimilation transcriptional regulator
MNLRQLQCFLEVAEARNVSRAATRVFISQSALSRQLQLLEQDLGVELFERKARGVVLTEAGSVLQRKAASLMQEVAAIKQAVGAHADEASGDVGLGIVSALRALFTGRIAARYAVEQPKVLLRVREGTSRAIRDALAVGDTDVALFSTEEPQQPLQCLPLLSEQLVAIGRPEANLSMARPITMRTLCAHPLILTAYPNSLRKIVDRAASKAGTRAQARIEVDMSTLMLDLARRGLGYAVLPYCAAHEPLAAGLVSVAPVKGLWIHWVLGSSRERSLSLGARRLIDTVIGEAAQMVAAGQWPTARLA